MSWHWRPLPLDANESTNILERGGVPDTRGGVANAKSFGDSGSFERDDGILRGCPSERTTVWVMPATGNPLDRSYDCAFRLLRPCAAIPPTFVCGKWVPLGGSWKTGVTERDRAHRGCPTLSRVLSDSEAPVREDMLTSFLHVLLGVTKGFLRVSSEVDDI